MLMVLLKIAYKTMVYDLIQSMQMKYGIPGVYKTWKIWESLEESNEDNYWQEKCTVRISTPEIEITYSCI